MIELFRKESIDRLSMQEHTGSYLNVVNPAGWFIMVAVLIFVTSFIIWGFTGYLPLSVSGLGYSHENDAECHVYINPDEFRSRNIDAGDQVYLKSPSGDTAEGKIVSVSESPYSADEIMKTHGSNEWVVQKVFDGNEYCYMINVESEKPLQADAIIEATIIEKKVHPIYFLLN